MFWAGVSAEDAGDRSHSKFVPKITTAFRNGTAAQNVSVFQNGTASRAGGWFQGKTKTAVRFGCVFQNGIEVWDAWSFMFGSADCFWDCIPGGAASEKENVLRNGTQAENGIAVCHDVGWQMSAS